MGSLNENGLHAASVTDEPLIPRSAPRRKGTDRRKTDQRGWRSTKNRIKQVFFYEFIALAIITPLYHLLSGTKAETALSMPIILSLVTLVWTYAFTLIFDRVEHKFDAQINESEMRPLPLRIFHAIGLELGLMVWTIPVIKIFTGLPWIETILLDIALTLTYMVYALCFFYVYDRLDPAIERRGQDRRTMERHAEPD